MAPNHPDDRSARLQNRHMSAEPREPSPRPQGQISRRRFVAGTLATGAAAALPAALPASAEAEAAAAATRRAPAQALAAPGRRGGGGAGRPDRGP